MNALGTDGHLEPAVEQVPELERPTAQQGRMRLDDHAPVAAQPLGNTPISRRRNRQSIEEASAVVELDGVGFGQTLQGVVELAQDLVGRDRRRGGVAPQVAHGARPRAFPVGQENHVDALQAAVGRPLLFVVEAVGTLRIDRGAGRP